MRRATIFAGLVTGMSLMAFNAAQAVEIEYWQYVFETRVKAMDQLIENFQKANPDITVKHTTFPYADYQTRVIAANMAGNGPDVMQLFYGWLDKFVDGKLVQPLSPEVFPHDKIESEFFPIVSAMKRGTTITACRQPCVRWLSSTTRSFSPRPASTRTSRRRPWMSLLPQPEDHPARWRRQSGLRRLHRGNGRSGSPVVA